MLAQLINTSTQTTIHLDALRLDGGTQPRDGLNTVYVSELAQAIEDGAALPPIDVMHDGANYWLYDGYHRVAAHRQANILTIPATIHQGSQQDAQWRSYAANQTHGLRRTNDDKKRAILAALRHPNAAALSDREIARHLGVDHKTVATYREHLQSTGEIPSQTQRTGADGRTIQTANIGAKPAPVVVARYTVEDLRAIVRACAVQTGLDPAPEGSPFWSKLTEFIKHQAETTNTYWSVSDLRQALDQVIRQNRRQLPEFTVPELVDLIRTCAQDTGLEPSVTGAFWHEVNAAITAAAGGRRWSPDLLRASIIAIQPPPARRTIEPPAPPAPATDPWLAAWGNNHLLENRETKLNRLVLAINEWALAWTDNKGRTWRDLLDHNPSHANSPFRQTLAAECQRRKLDLPGDDMATLIKKLFFHLLNTNSITPAPTIQPVDDRPMLSLNDNEWTAAGRAQMHDWAAAEAAADEAERQALANPIDSDITMAKPADLHVMATPPISNLQSPNPKSPTPLDPRPAQLNAWWVRLLTLRSELGDWAELTGRHTDTLGIVRELNKLIDLTQAELDAITTGAPALALVEA